MRWSTLRVLTFVCGVTTAWLGIPQESHAIFHHLFGGCFGRSCFAPTNTFQTAAIQPVMGAPACNTCAAPTQTVQYVPQTSYRTVMVNVPVTSYRPVTSFGLCSGCPATTLRPVRSYVQQARYVAYTTYRPVVISNYQPVACCNTCSSATTVGSYAAPATYAQSSSDCCDVPYSPPPPIPTTTDAHPETAEPPRPRATFEEPNGEPSADLRKIPSTGNTSTPYPPLLGPDLTDPDDRSTLHRARSGYSTAKFRSVPRSQEAADASGWRSVQRR